MEEGRGHGRGSARRQSPRHMCGCCESSFTAGGMGLAREVQGLQKEKDNDSQLKNSPNRKKRVPGASIRVRDPLTLTVRSPNKILSE